MRDMGDFLGWSVLVGPPSLPEPIVRRWKAALALLARDPDWKADMNQIGAISALGTITDNEKFLNEQDELYRRLIASAKLHQ